MDQLEQTELCRAYGLGPDTQVTLLHDGENSTYLATDGPHRLVIRRYRQGRFTESEIEAELSWIEALRPHVAVVEVIPTTDGQRSFAYQGRHYVAAPFLEEIAVEVPGADDYARLGRLMRSLHEGADRIMQAQPADWPGWQRPRYDEATLVAEPCQRLLQSEHVLETDRPRITRVAERLTQEFQSLRPVFVHNDLHFGNVMRRQEQEVVIDFDECGFGPRGLDFGVVRLHMRSGGHLDEMWPVFEAAYGRSIPPREAAVGTALRVFWMAAKILLRPEMVPDPQVRIQRYLGWIEVELGDSRHLPSLPTCDR